MDGARVEEALTSGRCAPDTPAPSPAGAFPIRSLGPPGLSPERKAVCSLPGTDHTATLGAASGTTAGAAAWPPASRAPVHRTALGDTTPPAIAPPICPDGSKSTKKPPSTICLQVVSGTYMDVPSCEKQRHPFDLDEMQAAGRGARLG